MHVSMMHKCTMHMSMILVPDVCMMHKFTMQISPILVSDVCSMHKCMMHISWPWSLMCVWCTCPWSWSLMYVRCTNAWCTCPWSWFLMYGWCTNVWCTYPRSWSLMYVWCTNVWCTYPWFLSLILLHAWMYDACIYDVAEILSRTDRRTDGQGVGWMYNVCMYDVTHVSMIHVWFDNYCLRISTIWVMSHKVGVPVNRVCIAQWLGCLSTMMR